MVANYAGAGFSSDYTLSELSLSNNLDTIAKIRSNDTWQPLTTEEKLEVLQAVCNCERNYWGIEFDVTVVLSDMDDDVYGSYDDSYKIISVNRKYLDDMDAYDALETCLHEMYHVWERCLVDLYLDASESQRKMRIFKNCDSYIEEIKNYQYGGDDYSSYILYYYQTMETDSREYSRKAIEVYYNEIDTLLEERQSD